jgi:hypothetical protein
MSVFSKGDAHHCARRATPGTIGLEASGSHGMKTAPNGVPSLSSLDGCGLKVRLREFLARPEGDRLMKPASCLTTSMPNITRHSMRSWRSKAFLFYRAQWIDMRRYAIMLKVCFAASSVSAGTTSLAPVGSRRAAGSNFEEGVITAIRVGSIPIGSRVVPPLLPV